MSVDLCFDLSGVGLRLRALPPGCARIFEQSWGAFLARRVEDPLLDLRVGVSGDPADARQISGRPVRSSFDGEGAEFAIEEGAARVDRAGHGEIRLKPGRDQMQFFSLVNLLLPVLAWRLPDRSRLLVHGAGIVVDRAGLALVGPAGSGKSTWVALAREQGATALSDDVILVDATPGEAALLGAPFRNTESGAAQPGRWPLAALLLPVHGAAAALSTVPPIMARARLAANLPYVAQRIEAEERIAAVIEGLVSTVGTHALTFALDASFYPLLRKLARPIG